MTRNSRKILRIKLFIIAFASVLAIFGFLNFPANHEKVSASSSGPSSSHTNAPGEANCTSCHTEFPLNSGEGEILIEGLPTNYLPDQEIPITVTVNDPDAVIYGFQMTAIDSLGKKVGTYTLPNQNPQQLQLLDGLVGGNMREYIEHTSAGTVPTQFGTKSWTFTWTAPETRVGKVSFYAAGNAADSSGNTNGDYIYTTVNGTLSGSAVSNFDNDLKSDIAVWRPSTRFWYVMNSSDGNFQAAPFGLTGDKIAPGDYDGDGINDLAVFRPSTGVWYVRKSTGGFIIAQFGLDGDIPAVGDYDGDGKSDLAVWRPSNGAWYVYRSSDGNVSIDVLGLSTDKITQADYDGDGKTDISIWRPSSGAWYVFQSTDRVLYGVLFGQDGDKPTQGDYDGDGKSDLAVYRPSERVWYVLGTRDGLTALQFGLENDKPTPADFDGDGKTDIAVWRPENAFWYILRSSNGNVDFIPFGLNGDIPVPSGYIPE